MVASYIKHFSPISVGLEERIVIRQAVSPARKQHSIAVNGIVFTVVTLGIILVAVFVYKINTHTKRPKQYAYQPALLNGDTFIEDGDLNAL